MIYRLSEKLIVKCDGLLRSTTMGLLRSAEGPHCFMQIGLCLRQELAFADDSEHQEM